MNMPFNPPTATAGPFRFSVDQFLALSDDGFFGEQAKTELLDGEIFVVNAQYRPHARTKAAMVRVLETALSGSEWSVLTEVTVRLSENDAPEPDIVVTDDPDGDGPVPAASVGLLIEICDTTHTNDLKLKPRRYARAGVPEYWVADLAGAKLHRHSAPGAEGYGRIDAFAFGETIVSVTLAGLSVPTASIGE